MPSPLEALFHHVITLVLLLLLIVFILHSMKSHLFNEPLSPPHPPIPPDAYLTIMLLETASDRPGLDVTLSHTPVGRRAKDGSGSWLLGLRCNLSLWPPPGWQAAV